MKKLIPATLLLLAVTINVFAKAGPPIPKPKVSISEAITIANNYFLNQDKMTEDDSFKKSDFIIISVKYANSFYGEKQNDWAWYVTFVHPKHNDYSRTYKITEDGNIAVVQVAK